MSRTIFHLIASLPLLFCLGSQFTNATITDTIRPGQSLNTSEYIQSANGSFGLGFISTENSTKHYVVIFYRMYGPYGIGDKDVVWVANREDPFPNSSAVLTFNPDGNLVISDGRLLYVLTNTSGHGNDTYVRLLDTGNLILTNRALDVLWKSFDNPTHTLFTGMKIKYANDHPVLTSWKSEEDPAPGPFSLHVGSRKELIILKESEPYWSSPLIGDLADIFVIDEEYITYSNKNSSEFGRVALQVTGELVLLTGSDDYEPVDLSVSLRCGAYAFCGEFSVCDETAYAPCDCLQGFKTYGYAKVCKRKTELRCSDVVQKHGFLRMSKVYLPSNPQQLHYVGNALE